MASGQDADSWLMLRPTPPTPPTPPILPTLSYAHFPTADIYPHTSHTPPPTFAVCAASST
ncbi:MAG: hypothetical protein HDS65_01110 [Bacteroidales bacterium]|nr:hypothetical protein [Bacteroidales bacterium]